MIVTALTVFKIALDFLESQKQFSKKDTYLMIFSRAGTTRSVFESGQLVVSNNITRVVGKGILFKF
jgi:hypothetical protein